MTDPRPAARLLVALLLLAALPAAAQPASSPEDELRRTETARFAAMVAGDTAALERMLGEDLSYTHSTGQVQDRREFLAALAAKSLRYAAMSPADVRVRVFGETGVVTGRIDMKVVVDQAERAIAARYTAVYVHRDGRWQLVAWQSSSIAAAPR